MKTTFKILTLILVAVLYHSCKKDTTSLSVPTLVTNDITSLTHIHAFSGGIITSDDNGMTTLSRGVCWSTSPNPTISDSKTSDLFGLSPGYFGSFISGLSANTTYYVRAYATNNTGTGYGQEIQFVTLDNFTGQTGTLNDGDGNSYQTIGIGSQIWMAENLKTTQFNDGTSIPNVSDNATWTTTTAPAYSYYDTILDNKNTYGALYNWHTLDTAVNGNKNVCPAGWHVPNEEEWKTLINFLGESVTGEWSMNTPVAGGNIAGEMLKESGTAHWIAPNNGTNEIGFMALPGGMRYPSGFFDDIGKAGTWWVSTKQNYGDMYPYYYSIYHDNSAISGGAWNRSVGFSVRCVKN
jgi:uncharacterized protein (TIGR02145 family)